jgi:hypothetical protein
MPFLAVATLIDAKFKIHILEHEDVSRLLCRDLIVVTAFGAAG